MKKILCFTNLEPVRVKMKKAVESLSESVPVEIIQLRDNTEWTKADEKKVATAGFVLVLWMGTGLSDTFLAGIHAFLVKRHIPFYFDESDLDEGEESGAVTSDVIERIRAYQSGGGVVNHRNLFLWLLHAFCDEKYRYEEPREYPFWGIYDPDEPDAFWDTREYIARFHDSKKPTVGLIFYRNDWQEGILHWQAPLIRILKEEGCNVLAVFATVIDENHSGAPSLGENMKQAFYVDGKPVIDVLINPITFGLISTDLLVLDDLKQLNVAVLQVYNMYSSYDWWKNHTVGLTANEVAYAVALPEFDGVIHSVPISTQEMTPDGTHVQKPMIERMHSLARRAKKWAMLRKKRNKDKKVAIIFHNCPPDNSHIGGACQLDSIESMRRLLWLLKDRGYEVENLPQDTKEFMQELTTHATNDRRFMSEALLNHADGVFLRDDYKAYFHRLPEATQEHVEKDWGKAPGELFIHEGNMIVPGTLKGHIFVTVQPARGFGDHPDSIYHDPNLSPTHQYLGAYEWIRNVWNADAIIHVGTHGTVEWLPGKGVALSNECYPDICVDDIPDIYPYWVTCIGEGIEAKRRGAACIIDHLPAPMSLAGTYDEYAKLEKTLEEYAHYQKDEENPDYAQQTENLIREEVAECHLDKEIKEEEFRNFNEYAHALHHFIADLKNMQIQVGLHILGEVPSGEKMTEFIFALTKMENGDIPGLAKTLALAKGYDYYKLMEEGGRIDEKTGLTYLALLDQVTEEAKKFILTLQKGGFTEKSIADTHHISFIKSMTAEQKEIVDTIAHYINETIVPSLEKTTDEQENILRALEGEYIEPGPAGSPTAGGADILPTGRNFYSVDPRILPTRPAWEIGKQMTDGVIEQFIADEGRYPESVGIILWATSNMRNHGTCMSEFLYLMGLKPQWEEGNQRVIGVEVIPLSELKRPRIDVTGRISGLFRDTLPASVRWLDDAANRVAALDEPIEMNFVRKHVLEDAEELEKEGLTKEEAWKKASYRIFGDPPGCYGAGVDAALEAKNWQNIDDLGAVYMRWGGYAYDCADGGNYLPKQFKKRLSQVEITIQNVDQRESSMLSSDDYNAYRGGLVAAVRSCSGKMPKNYVSDSSDKKKIITRTLEDELKRRFRGEAMNPKYIEGMKKHGYKGAVDLAEYLVTSFAWDATSDIMEDWMYDEYTDKYVLDKNMQEWFKEVNPWALSRMIDTLLEAVQRNMWHADEKRVEALKNLLLDVEGEMEESSDS